MFLKGMPLAVSFCLLVAAAVALNRHIEAEGRRAHAATATDVATSGSCSDPLPGAFAPNVTYTITWSSPGSGAPTCSATVGLTGAVNGDTAPSVTCSLAGNGGYVELWSRGPSVKFGGLACSTEDRSTLAANGDGVDTPLFNTTMQPPTDTSYTSAHQVDDNTSASPATIYGTSGQCGSAALIDGNDNDGLVNGEIAFGGTTTATGGHRGFVAVDVTGVAVNTTTHVETLTLTFTPQ